MFRYIAPHVSCRRAKVVRKTSLCFSPYALATDVYATLLSTLQGPIIHSIPTLTQALSGLFEETYVKALNGIHVCACTILVSDVFVSPKQERARHCDAQRLQVHPASRPGQRSSVLTPASVTKPADQQQGMNKMKTGPTRVISDLCAQTRCLEKDSLVLRSKCVATILLMHISNSYQRGGGLREDPLHSLCPSVCPFVRRERPTQKGDATLLANRGSFFPGPEELTGRFDYVSVLHNKGPSKQSQNSDPTTKKLSLTFVMSLDAVIQPTQERVCVCGQESELHSVEAGLGQRQQMLASDLYARSGPIRRSYVDKTLKFAANFCALYCSRTGRCSGDVTDLMVTCMSIEK
ncbi:hypothetical protein CBL_10969 [Carabus blaptoides fortunei]